MATASRFHVIFFGFTQLKTGACVYQLTVISQNVNGTFILGVFFDDVLCLGTSTSIIQWFQSLLSEIFSITIKSDVESFLGMNVTRNRSTKCVSLSQPGYISSLMSRFQVKTSSNSSNPTCSMSSLDLQDSNNIPLTPSQQKLYMQIVGSLLFLSTRSRPDLSFPVNYLSLYMTKGNQHHLDLCYKVLQYLWLSRHLTLTFNGTKGINFYVMVDSSYASHSDRKSSYVLSVYMNDHSGSCISVSKKSTLLALSSTKAEYIGM